jgi:hypothetical protein
VGVWTGFIAPRQGPLADFCEDGNDAGLFKKYGAKIKACGESGKNGNRSITEGNEGERLQVRACVCMHR